MLIQYRKEYPLINRLKTKKRIKSETESVILRDYSLSNSSTYSNKPVCAKSHTLPFCSVAVFLDIVIRKGFIPI